MHSSFSLGIWIFHEHQLRVWLELFDFREFHKVVDPFAIVFEMEAGVLEGIGRLDDRLSHILNLLLLGDHQGHFVGMMGQLDRDLEESSSIWVVMAVGMLVLVGVPFNVVSIDSNCAIDETRSCGFGARSVISFCRTRSDVLVGCSSRY